MTIGPLHPFPTPVPHWIGPVPLAFFTSDSPAKSNAGGSNMVVDNQRGNRISPADPVADDVRCPDC